jgi:hypothetical protein
VWRPQLTVCAGSDIVAASFVSGRPARRGAPGKAVRIRRDPVTVTGDETRMKPLAQQVAGREGAGSRTIRKPGDLPERATLTGLRGRIRVKWFRSSFIAHRT